MADDEKFKQVKKVKEALNDVSPSFCLAKWMQVTVHLQNGFTHSCHHPTPHKIPLQELAQDPSALHNTMAKKFAREQMKKGERPHECSYCWNVEDAHPENLSDRYFKSSEVWANPYFDKIKNSDPFAPVNPSYLEVSFGNECNFKCGYCSPYVSSAIMAEHVKHGPYSMVGGYGIEKLKESGHYPYGKDEFNPYVDAFWKWWPSLKKDLKVFRITGGEPLLNPNTFEFLDQIKKHPMPDLDLAINSNLGIPEKTLQRFIDDIKYITDHKLVKSFQLYTSVDTFGKNAEFVRFGLNYDQYMKNVRHFLTEVQNAELVFMCTYNVFSVINFTKYLEEVTELKKSFLNPKGWTRVFLDTPYLKDPVYLSCYILTDSFWHFIEKDLIYLKQHAKTEKGLQVYYDHEISKFERILNWLKGLGESQHRDGNRVLFARFVEESCARKDIHFEDYCPEYLDFLNYCRSLDPKNT